MQLMYILCIYYKNCKLLHFQFFWFAGKQKHFESQILFLIYLHFCILKNSQLLHFSYVKYTLLNWGCRISNELSVGPHSFLLFTYSKLQIIHFIFLLNHYRTSVSSLKNLDRKRKIVILLKNKPWMFPVFTDKQE